MWAAFRFCRPLAHTSKAAASPWNGRHKLPKETTYHRIRLYSYEPPSSSFRERLRDLRQNGTPEIAIGSVVLALLGIDYILQVRNDTQREDMYRQLERGVRHDEAISREEDRKMLSQGMATKSKFKCIIRKVPPNFDGHKCLKDVKVGDVISVIEESVGPGGQYSLCFIERGSTATNNAGKDSLAYEQSSVSIGWFPCSCLQKID